MKLQRLYRIYWLGFLLFPIIFFSTSRASLFEAGHWIDVGSAPGFDTTLVKSGTVPLKYWAFGFALNQSDYYLLEFFAFISILIFMGYLTIYAWRITAS